MSFDPEQAVHDRYSSAAQDRKTELCCPISYDPKYLEVIPDEVLERDYGCGDPSKHVRPGETVLDLGSGGGKICFIASQVVGAEGRVIGVDMNADMLALARRSAPVVAERLGYDNVEFREGKIQDLQPTVGDASVDVVVSNCVLNLVAPEDKAQLFSELFRVLKKGGRAVISDIVADEDVPEEMQRDATLWSGCVSGALREDAFLKAFTDVGFYGVRILARDVEPWQTVNGYEFRSLTVEAFKGKEGPCFEKLQAVIYKGPFTAVVDDLGHRIPRGVRYAVCEKTYDLFSKEPYREQFEFVEPLVDTPDGTPFDCARDSLRHPRATKGLDYDRTTDAAACCGPDDACC